MVLPLENLDPWFEAILEHKQRWERAPPGSRGTGTTAGNTASPPTPYSSSQPPADF